MMDTDHERGSKTVTDLRKGMKIIIAKRKGIEEKEGLMTGTNPRNMRRKRNSRKENRNGGLLVSSLPSPDTMHGMAPKRSRTQNTWKERSPLRGEGTRKGVDG